MSRSILLRKNNRGVTFFNILCYLVIHENLRIIETFFVFVCQYIKHRKVFY